MRMIEPSAHHTIIAIKETFALRSKSYSGMNQIAIEPIRKTKKAKGISIDLSILENYHKKLES